MLQDFKQSLLISASCLQDQWLFLSTFPVYGSSPSRGGESGVPTLPPLPLVPVWEGEKSWEASLVKFSLLPLHSSSSYTTVPVSSSFPFKKRWVEEYTASRLQDQ